MHVNQKIVIVGSQGTLGSALITELSQCSQFSNSSIVAIDKIPFIGGVTHPNINHVQMDIECNQRICDYVADADIVFWKLGVKGGAESMAFANEAKYFNINTKPVTMLIESGALSRCGKFIFDSTEQVFGDSYEEGLRTTHSIPRPINYYGLSKLVTERALLSYYEGIDRAVDILIYRYPRVHGINTDDVINKMVASALIDGTIYVSNRDKLISFVDINSVTQANICAAVDKSIYGIHHVCNGESITTARLATLIADHVCKIRGGVRIVFGEPSPLPDFEPQVGGLDSSDSYQYLSVDDMIRESIDNRLATS